MSRKRLIWQLLPPYLGVIAVVLVGIAFFAASDMTRFYQREKAKDLESLAYVVSDTLAPFLDPSSLSQPGSELGTMCKRLATRSRTRITVVNREGLVLCDSERDPLEMDNHSARPEIQDAWKSGSGMAVRYSYTLEKPMMYAAVPAEIDGRLFAIRISVPASRMSEALWSTKLRFGFGVMIAGLLIILTTAYLSSRITRSLKEIRSGARRFAGGDFSNKIMIPKTAEFAELAQEMNQMAHQLDERIQTVINQRNELEAVLASMVEGVLAFDTRERLISLNAAAAKLLDLDRERILNKTIQEAIRNSELQDFVARTLDSRMPIEGEILFYNGGERYLQAHGTPLRDAAGKNLGALVVLNDVTRLRRLERIRREFVANASHEIRTPITSIKGFVETLQDGAMNERETLERFLSIIKKHSDRLDAIVQDLLNLSRIEKEAEKGEIFLEEGKLCEVVGEAVEACLAGAEERHTTIEVQCPDDLRARISPSLLIQALINLIDNAVKYSEPESVVRVECFREETGVHISVKDHGAGIDKRHIPRLFERFYRVDKARSRTLGGTGLGLAIVKHIAQVHSGEVAVESEPGKGSTFTIVLPSSS